MKVIKTRLDIAEKKMSARVKFMKSDIAELLRIGFDFDAYKRVLLILQMFTHLVS